MMSYETIDWNAEALRVARAFGVEGEFRDGGFYDKKYLSVGEHYEAIPFTGAGYGELFSVVYTFDQMQFEVWNTWNHTRTDCHIGYDGSFSDGLSTLDKKKFPIAHRYPLARALFHLDLLTPEVEEALQVSVSAHEKMEWTMGYEARLKAAEVG